MDRKVRLAINQNFTLGQNIWKIDWNVLTLIACNFQVLPDFFVF